MTSDDGLLYLKEFWITWQCLFSFQIHFSIWNNIASCGYGDRLCWTEDHPGGSWYQMNLVWMWFWLTITIPWSRRKNLQFHYPEEYPPDKRYGGKRRLDGATAMRAVERKADHE